MDHNGMRRIKRERGLIDMRDTVDGKQRMQMVSPTVTRRPVLDQMLGDMALVAMKTLESLRTKVLNHGYLDKQELREFKEICETVLRQTRVEMEVEKHVQERNSGLTKDQIREKLLSAMTREKVPPNVQDTVLKALGMVLRGPAGAGTESRM